MNSKLRFQSFLIILIPGILLFVLASMMVAPQAFVPTTLNDFFLPGSQPLQSGTIDSPGFCDNCHGGYDINVEPAFNWRGSMMAQAQRDPLYLACLAIANQDAPDVGDLCIRCHTPKGWLEGRSVPTNGSALTAADREGVQCHFCHKLIAPTPIGVNPYPFDALYTTPPASNIPSTYTIDQGYLPLLSNIPPNHSNGMYVADNADNRRGPYYNPQSNHNTPYSPFHTESKLCGTCHDVSNPVYQAVKDANGNYLGYTPNSFNQPSPSFNPYDMFPIERTYSEWLMSAYNTPGGISGTYFGGNKTFVSTCQDCHMRDVTGKGCNKNFAPVRNDLPLHDMTGGNTFIPDLIKILFPGEVNNAALDAGKVRALDMLQHAASVQLTVNQMQKEVIVKVTNETAHKLPSGYPEGRRIWINLKASNSLTAQSYESGYYDVATGYLNKTGVKVYEIKPGLSPGLASAVGLTPGESFHFVLNDTIYFDNRIPPRGFTNANFNAIQSPPVGYNYADGQYWDETVYNLPFYPDAVEVTLYYQTTTKEYVEFLRDENVTNNAGQVMYNLWNTNGKSAPVAMNHHTWSGPPVGPEAPVADFVADISAPAIGQTVTFTDHSTNAPTSWNWSFNPGSVTYVGGTLSSSQNPQVRFNVPGNYMVELTATNAAGSDTETKYDYIMVLSPTFGLDLRVFLEGPFVGPMMSTVLNANNSLPLIQPFNVAPWFYNGGESVIGIPDPEIVDWVLIELRETSGDASTANSLKAIGRMAAFVKSDGSIIAKDGINLPEFELMVADNLFVVIWHRNHLGIISAVPVIRSGENYIYDFSSSDTQAYGGVNAQKQLTSNIWGMIAADGNSDGTIDDSDRNYPWMIEAGLSGYYFGDYNLDNQVNNLDKNDYWLPNTGKSSYVPD
jgi:PKD repeat protein